MLSGETLQASEEAGRMLTALVPDIQRTSELVSEISAACREQSVGIDQINQAIQQLDQVTQSNAGAANAMSATAEELSAEAGRLEERAGFFRLTDGERAAALAAERQQIARMQAEAPPRPTDVRGLQETAARFAASRRAPAAPAAAGFDMALDGNDEFERMSR